MPQKRNKLRIGISDESPFIVYSIQTILTAELTRPTISPYPVDGEDLLIKLIESPPDVLITDLNISPGNLNLNGIRKIEEIRKQLPKMDIIIFTDQTNLALLNKVIQITISGIVSKRDKRYQLFEAFRWISGANKGIFFSEQMKNLSSERLSFDRNNVLTPSETEIIRLFSLGYSLINIAKFRKRSVSTVATQKYNAMRKLHLNSNTDLIKYVLTQELN
ncbi:DNA-binding response regulator [Erwinia billingiae]|nr:DNA-binding response regulator [Erwinia billingiae]